LPIALSKKRSAVIDRLQRHTLLRIDAKGWQGMLERRAELAALPYLRTWAQQGWPVIVRRRWLGEPRELIPAAIPLPPSSGKLRIALQLSADDIANSIKAVTLLDSQVAAPESWRTTLDSIVAIAGRCGVKTHVFGSLLWQFLTGIQYIGPNSDVDLLWHVTTLAQARELANGIDNVETDGELRIDGEFILPDGAGLNWREFHRALDCVLVKTLDGVARRSTAELFNPDSCVP
jgi:phosphoribosyl-dephospho-CoA transferase